MKLTVAPESPIERLLLALGVPPVTLMDTHMSFLRARCIMVATRLGVFEVLRSGPLSSGELASQLRTAPVPTEKLLNALVGSGYATFGHGRYALSATSRKWLTSESPVSLRDKVLFEFVEWALLEKCEEYVRTGQPLDIHGSASNEQWALYQRAMRALSGLAAHEIVRRTPMPKSASTMLDIGGSHGFISVAMCRRYSGLRAVILDLPAAVAQAAPILAREGMGDRVTHRPGDALVDDLGKDDWDFVFISQLVHHFDDATNRALVQRIARALRPDGVLAVLDMVRPTSPNDVGQVGSLLDLYFALTSQAGTWSVEEMQGWQHDAGLTTRRPIWLRTAPGVAEIVAVKSRARRS
jgi:SAM-dependent methyltransferase